MKQFKVENLLLKIYNKRWIFLIYKIKIFKNKLNNQNKLEMNKNLKYWIFNL